MRIATCLWCCLLSLALTCGAALADELWKGDPQAAGQRSGLSAAWRQFWDSVDLHRQRVSQWPDPFLGPDREAVRQPFRVMADNGWKLQNTLTAEFFEDTKEAKQELTDAGRRKVYWIVTQFPPHRRSIFVLAAEEPTETQARYESVQRYLTRIGPSLPSSEIQPALRTTYIVPAVGDGSYLDHVEKSYRTSTPLPRLPGGTGPVNLGPPVNAAGRSGGDGEKAP